ncbi:DinB family protein [Actinopolymorpha singaporensis]
MPAIDLLLREYDRARAFTDELWRDLTPEEVTWRPHENFSPIGWHLGHQAHVAHFMVRNLTAAEPSPDPELDPIMDSANPEAGRGALPDLRRLATFRENAARTVHKRIGDIRDGDVGAPAQLAMVAKVVMAAVVNHEYQHSKWISEVRARDLGHALPDLPTSDLLLELDGYLVCDLGI